MPPYPYYIVLARDYLEFREWYDEYHRDYYPAAKYVHCLEQIQGHAGEARQVLILPGANDNTAYGLEFMNELRIRFPGDYRWMR